VGLKNGEADSFTKIEKEEEEKHPSTQLTEGKTELCMNKNEH
jgi:hypothetical protein